MPSFVVVESPLVGYPRLLVLYICSYAPRHTISPFVPPLQISLIFI